MTDSIDAPEFYQVRLFKKGSIEIFQNVFYHHIGVLDGKVQGIYIKYSPDKNTGICTHSTRTLGGVYDIQILDESSEYEFRGSFPKDIEIIIH